MKKVVNGKLYDTEKAECFCEYSFSNKSDFRYVEEALYKSHNGQFFIEFEGGPRSEYGVHSGQRGLIGSCGIRLVTEAEARVFVEEYGTTKDYVKAFGEPELG